MLSLAIAAIALTLPKTAPTDTLLADFKNPPLSARPHTWWHWMNGNVTKVGITADLEAMREVGIGGAQMFTVDQGIPAGPAGYNGPLWRELTAFAVSEAHRLGIELCIHNCAGWSSSGGPWLKPEDGMQVLAWSTKTIAGGKVDVTLDPIKAPKVYASVPYSEDIAVFAIPGKPAQNTSGDFLGRTGVVRQDGLVPNLTPEEGTPQPKILNLTNQTENGHLQCELPAGTWTILRLGHVPTGIDNHPAPPEGDGLEVDKLSKEALLKHWNGMMAKVIADVGPLAGQSLNNSLIDSYEVGTQNWTPKFVEDFRRLRGYSPLPYMPAIAGFTVDNRAITERFLWDYRRTIADLFAENYYGFFGTLCHQHGLKFSTEPYGDGGFDNMQAGGTADIPMGEFWLGGLAIESTKLASSIGHTYGRKVVGAESFTADEGRGRFLEEPYMMKTVGDLAFVNGINRYIFHRFAQQPWTDLRPGMTMGPWGTHLDRTQTWWKEAATWLKYVSRSQYLLQSGHFIADAVVYTGESAPVDLPYARGSGRVVPEGYDYDGCDTRILMALKVENGSLITPSGMQYRMLVLPKTDFMSLMVAHKIMDLVKAGANVVGPRPIHSPSLAGYPESDAEVAAIGTKLFGKKVLGDHAAIQNGKGKVFPTATPAIALQLLGIKPDFAYLGGAAKLLHHHRKIGTTDVYFVSNQRYQGAVATCIFRVTGKQPELWHPETGRTELAPVWREADGATEVSLRFQPAESVFVVFRNKPRGAHFSQFTTRHPASQKSPTLTVVSARYETADGRGYDVTENVARMVKNGDTEIEATNSNFGEPALNVVKHLTVTYKIGNKLTKLTVSENETLTLTPTGPPATANDYDLETGANGATIAYPWRKGIWNTERDGAKRVIHLSKSPEETDLSRGWNVSFPPNLGAPSSAAFAQLTPWNANPTDGIKYFSGSATYTKDFTYAPVGRSSLNRVRLDLGNVKNFATVTLNGKPLGTLWKPPFTIDVTSAIKRGKNRLQVKVTNLWVNRLIGDEQLPPDVEWEGTHLKQWPAWLLNHQPRPKTGRIAFVTWKFYSKDSPLLDSGLLGPVIVQTTAGIKLR